MKDHQEQMLATSRVDGKPETCGAPCPPWLKAAGLPCQEPKGHGGGRDNPHRHDFEKPLDDGTLGSVWFDGEPIPGLVCAECDKPIVRGDVYAGRTGNATHRICMSAAGIAEARFKIAGDPSNREP